MAEKLRCRHQTPQSLKKHLCKGVTQGTRGGQAKRKLRKIAENCEKLRTSISPPLFSFSNGLTRRSATMSVAQKRWKMVPHPRGMFRACLPSVARPTPSLPLREAWGGWGGAASVHSVGEPIPPGGVTQGPGRAHAAGGGPRCRARVGGFGPLCRARAASSEARDQKKTTKPLLFGCSVRPPLRDTREGVRARCCASGCSPRRWVCPTRFRGCPAQGTAAAEDEALLSSWCMIPPRGRGMQWMRPFRMRMALISVRPTC